MAEINEAYASMTRGGYRPGRASAGRWADGGTEGDGGRRRSGATGGPPKPRPTRPVTGRVDMSGTVRPRNAPLRSTPPTVHGSAADGLSGQPPLRWTTEQREPPRASHPSGPLERDRVRDFRPPPLPPLDAARDHELPFGKFRGHTLGQVAAFEPSYVDWLARTITRDPELVAAARSVQADLDRPRRHPPRAPDGRERAPGPGAGRGVGSKPRAATNVTIAPRNREAID